MKKTTSLEWKKTSNQSFYKFFSTKKWGKKMRGKLKICTKCGGDLQNHVEGCDCKKAISKLSFSDDEI